jgi:hypothetical protein
MGTGGSRYGAGRPGWRRKCEQKLSFDIRRLQRKGCLAPGQYFSWSWSRGDEPAGSVSVTTSDQAVTLNYSWTPYGQESRNITCRLSLTRTPCHYGNTRPWFICPDCGRRCAVVYGLSRRGNFACRACQRLAYSSEAEAPMDRLWRKQSRLEARLIEDGDRPTRMHQRTFERLWERIGEIEEQRDTLFVIGAARLLGLTSLEKLLL